ncbi:MAG: hypothetical protein ACC657_13945 [Thiohalomonadales bacterium]
MGRIAVGTKLLGNVLMANQAFRVIQIGVYAYRASAAAVAGTAIMTGGFATMEFGVGFILIVVGFIVSVVGEIFLQEANRPRIIKDLDYYFFGKH